MKNIFMMALVAILANSCQAQEKKNDSFLAQKSGTSAKPKGNWKVNKQTDENGNLVRYDSIYSWSSSGNNDQIKSEDMDSLINSIQAHFSSSMGAMPSIMGQDDFIKQFFSNGFFGNDSTQVLGFEAMRKQMEAMQQQFMQQARPRPIIPAEPEEKSKEL